MFPRLWKVRKPWEGEQKKQQWQKQQQIDTIWLCYHHIQQIKQSQDAQKEALVCARNICGQKKLYDM